MKQEAEEGSLSLCRFIEKRLIKNENDNSCMSDFCRLSSRFGRICHAGSSIAKVVSLKADRVL